MHALLLTQSPQSHQATQAFAMAEKLCQQQASLSVFLYMDAVYMANRYCWQTSDQTNLQQKWQQLAKTHNFSLKVCVSNALSRGITDAENSQRQGITLLPNPKTSNLASTQTSNPQWADNLAKGFHLVGLGDLAEDMLLADSVYLDSHPDCHITHLERHNLASEKKQMGNKRLLLQLTTPIDIYSEEALLAVFALASFEHDVKITLSHEALSILNQPTHKVYKMLSSVSFYDILIFVNAQIGNFDGIYDIPLTTIDQPINAQDFDLIWSV